MGEVRTHFWMLELVPKMIPAHCVLPTDPKTGECGFIPGILVSVPKLKGFGFPPFPSALPRCYYCTRLF